MRSQRTRLWPGWIRVGGAWLGSFLFLINCFAETASYYTYKSCLKEGSSGVMANGKRLDDSGFSCASWDYPFGTKLIIFNLANGKSVRVTVTDRGPAKRLYRRCRVIDLSLAAFKKIADPKVGIIKIKIMLDKDVVCGKMLQKEK